MEKRKLTREQIAQRIARDLQTGDIVNIGIGIPVLVSNYVASDAEIIYHSEQGVLGMGKKAKPGEEDPDLVNASKEPVTLVPGGSYSHSADSFAMARGKHIDVAILGGMQVSEKGDLANWKVKGVKLGSIGGAMDIAIGAKKIFIAMTHTSKSGEIKIVNQLDYPVTALHCVNRIYTDLAVIDVTRDGLILKEIAPGFTIEEVQEVTEPKLIKAEDLKVIEV
ncbi:3-oxoacid CoA-transferase subunit B [Robertmurraya kyonggiensis]|uniref:3-oxoacid CoA-transferase subunit B n=1 Tax=Robertmurraya kyonggiensis TaxID=1037680 RepID=A0A4U1D5W3_9BACI|nr:3-oxoacid CoA-transferase subunit B [Robertmurraya kyonggiensis]TKC16406.1 3-oxoacid CoA-transferase subunit B [Robertmurraya kyonggiensis]